MTEAHPGLVAVQHRHPEDPRRDVPLILEKAARTVEDGGIAVLPEYFYKPAQAPPTDERFEELGFVRDAVLEATTDVDGVLVATVPEVDGAERYNTALVAQGGEALHEQRKIRPTEAEREAGIQAADGLAVTEVEGMRLGVLVCADVLALDLVSEMAALDPDVVAVPVLSPNRESDSTRSARTSVFIARAWDLGAYVVKAGGHAKPHIAGRSLITAPWGLLADAPGDFEDVLLHAPYQADRLDAARSPFEPLR